MNLIRLFEKANPECIRYELEKYFLEVCHTQLDAIYDFAHNNIKTRNPRQKRTGLLAHLIENNTLKTLTAAVYFANARYLDRPVQQDKEKIILYTRTKKGSATYDYNGQYEHEISIPHKEWFDSIEDFLSALDAETRHAIHYNLLQDKDKNFKEDVAAERAKLVITETIDEGERPIPKQIDLLIDPYINDYWMINEEDGHAGAKYLTKYLSFGTRSRQQQLQWLARLPIRKHFFCMSNHYKLIDICEELKNIEKKYTNKLSPTPTTDISIIQSPYTTGTQPLIRFYTNQKPTNTIEEKLFAARHIALREPYQPNDTIIINDQQITTFASQLDYVVLKLTTTKPEDLRPN